MSDEDTLHPEAEQPQRPEDGTTQSLPALGAPGSESARTPSTLDIPRDGRAPAPSSPRPIVPGYEILEELGRGGVGVVYKARQIGLNRIVALKMILAAEHAGREAVARFRAEAEAVAQLKHPNIVQVYDIGEQDGRPYFSMEFVEGGSLARRISGNPQQPRWCAEICEKLALAMHLAHSQGIVHRDLKPANVLFVVQASSLPDAGRMPAPQEPKIMDFGLAKRLESGTTLTQSGVIMGTPQYMAPEQASGEAKRVGPPADVYALGAILYTMLTGHPPFSADTPLGLLRKVLGEEPTPPTTLHKRISPDLETICLKCLQKEPAKRYASAHELAADLRRFLNHEPIVARPAGPWEHAAKWAKRRPAAAALMGVSVLALAGLIGGGVWYNAQLFAERNNALRHLADSLASQADALCLAGRPQESLERYSDARSTLTGLGEPTFAVETGIFELRNSYPAPLVTFSGHTDKVCTALFSPNGKLALSGSGDNTLKLWDVATGRELRTFRDHTACVEGVAFSPDGKLVLSGSMDSMLKLWDVATGREVRTFSGHTGTVWSVSFSPDGDLALSGSGDWIDGIKKDNTLKLWDVAAGRELRTFSGHTREVLSVAFSPNGNLALSGSVDNTLKLWDVATGRELRTFRGHKDSVCSIAFSPDGNLVLSGSKDKTLKLWDVATGRELRTFSGHTNAVESVAFSPDEKLALSGSMDNTLKLWDVATGRELRAFSGCTNAVESVAFSPDGKLALSGGRDHKMKLWNLSVGQAGEARGRELRICSGHKDTVFGVAFSPDGKLGLSGSRDNTLKLWDVATGRELRAFNGHTSLVVSVAFSPNGKVVLSGSGDQTMKLWDVATGHELRTFSGHNVLVESVAFSPDGNLALSGSGDQTMKLWDVATGRDLRTFSGHTKTVCSVAFSPDGKLALSGSEDKTLKLWDVATGRELRTFSGHTDAVSSVEFSPDGKLALSGSSDRTLKLWDVATGREVLSFSGHGGDIMSVAFSPDGNLALSGSGDNTMKLWDLLRERELRTFSGHTGKVSSVAFSPDGMGIISGSSDKTLQYRDFTRPARYREFDTLLPKAREAIQKNENDAEALKTFGEWYAFRGVNGWAVEMLEKARKNGANVLPLTLARCYWLLAEDGTVTQLDKLRHRAAAAAEFQKELARVKAQPVPQDAKAKLARENEELYLNLCVQAVSRTAAGATENTEKNR